MISFPIIITLYSLNFLTTAIETRGEYILILSETLYQLIFLS